LSFPFPRSLPLVYTLPNDLPSNHGQALVLFLPTPFSLSLFRLLHVAILSDRIFCFAAIDFAACSFRSSLDGKTQSVEGITQHEKWEQKILVVHTKLSCSSPSSFSILLAFFNLPSPPLALTPSIYASAFAHFPFSSIAFRFSYGNAALSALGVGARPGMVSSY
jgi:hypothetical protein